MYNNACTSQPVCSGFKFIYMYRYRPSVIMHTLTPGHTDPMDGSRINLTKILTFERVSHDLQGECAVVRDVQSAHNHVEITQSRSCGVYKYNVYLCKVVQRCAAYHIQ